MDYSADYIIDSDYCDISIGRCLTASASQGDAYIYVSHDVSVGDTYRIGDATLFDDVKIKTYNNIDGIAYLDAPLAHDHSDDDDMFPLFATYQIDASTNDWADTLGQDVVILLTPDNDDMPVRIMASVDAVVYQAPELEHDFKTLYPNEARFIDNFGEFFKVCKRRLESALKVSGVLIEKLPDISVIDDIMLDFMRYQILLSSGDKYNDELDAAQKAYLSKIEIIKSLLIWQDTDNNNTKETVEVQKHKSAIFSRGF
jgi:hypothetical protein